MLIGSALAWDKARRRRSTERFETLPAPCVQWTTASACREPQHTGEFSDLSNFGQVITDISGNNGLSRQGDPRIVQLVMKCVF